MSEVWGWSKKHLFVSLPPVTVRLFHVTFVLNRVLISQCVDEIRSQQGRCTKQRATAKIIFTGMDKPFSQVMWVIVVGGQTEPSPTNSIKVNPQICMFYTNSAWFKWLATLRGPVQRVPVQKCHSSEQSISNFIANKLEADECISLSQSYYVQNPSFVALHFIDEQSYFVELPEKSVEHSCI